MECPVDHPYQWLFIAVDGSSISPGNEVISDQLCFGSHLIQSCVPDTCIMAILKNSMHRISMVSLTCPRRQSEVLYPPVLTKCVQHFQHCSSMSYVCGVLLCRRVVVVVLWLALLYTSLVSKCCQEVIVSVSCLYKHLSAWMSVLPASCGRGNVHALPAKKRRILNEYSCRSRDWLLYIRYVPQTDQYH